jgi:TRAP-type C4-dicarboxylate transport system permease large subunit
MFQAALLPGLLAAVGYLIAVAVFVRLYPDAGPAAERHPIEARLQELARVWPVLAIFVVFIGGIYWGIFTPTEGAAVGAFLTGVLAFFRKALNKEAIRECLLGTVSATAMIFMILLGAEMLNAFLALT